jgi:hypothetical protein
MATCFNFQITKTLEKVEGVKEDEEDTKRPVEYLEDDGGLEVSFCNIVTF